MDGNDVSADGVIAELIDMGFEFDRVLKAIEIVGLSLDAALDFILNGSCDGGGAQGSRVSSALVCSTRQPQASSSRTLKQLSIKDHVPSFNITKRSTSCTFFGDSSCGTKKSRSGHLSGQNNLNTDSNNYSEPVMKISQQEPKLVSYLEIDNAQCQESSESPLKVGCILQKHFGFSSLKGFQKEALQAWLDSRDCLVLAATGSGKSLCFQIPALLSGKIVVVISPLISLMHDQCLKLSKHGISACFLGSGQPDVSVERKAMSGMYNIIYVCPETVLRLVEPLKKLAENRGIALFAIDEVHCISKWGHDFRPDYRRLSVLRENFSATKLKFLKFDIPLMALTATATIPVREDIIKSLHMSKETKTILTSFFRPNLQFSVKHSRTSCVSSYKNDLHELIETYARGKRTVKLNRTVHSPNDNSDSFSRPLDGCDSDKGEALLCDTTHEDDEQDTDDSDVNLVNNCDTISPEENELSVEYLEDVFDTHQGVDDFDVSCGEFIVKSSETLEFSEASEKSRLQASLEEGPTIIYVPTRKETLKLAEYLSRSGVRAAAYHAKLPKSHLRRVHEEFHHDVLQVVVATIAFGMGIDKSNVRRIIHYGWPQSLEAYYQEAGRAGRDGKLSHCTLYANLSRIPTLLPSQRTEEQKRQAYKMLSDCFRYGMNTSTCRAKILVKYFGEEFHSRCHLCDICVAEPPRMQDIREETVIFLRVLKAEYGQTSLETEYDNGAIYTENCNRKFKEKPDLRMLISKIRLQFQKFSASDQLWWQGLARILENKGYISEQDGLKRVSIKYPEPTQLGLMFLQTESERTLYSYPEADMLLSMEKQKPHSTFSEWGRGWADPEVRRQRLQRIKSRTTKRKRPFKRHSKDLNTVRGRLAAKLDNLKR